MSITIKTEDLIRVRELFLLYSKKGAFLMEEYVEAGTVYKTIQALLEAAEKDEDVSLEKKDAGYVLSTINVCSQRAPVEVQNYKPIAQLFETLSEAIKATDGEETKPAKRK